MRLSFAAAAVLVLFLAACSGKPDSAGRETVPAQPDSSGTRDGPAVDASADLNDGEKIRVLAADLQAPWSIARHGDTFYVSERAGTIAEITAGEVRRMAVNLSSPLSGAAEAGLMGFVLKPDFPESGEAFAFYTYDDASGPASRIVTLRRDNEAWTETEIHLDRVPSGRVHHGGRLAFSPDGVLFATIGDRMAPDTAQDPDSPNGKIVRMEPGGTFRIHSLGHRNPQGLAWSDDGTMYATEHGQNAHDELNRIVEGRNYGWPLIEGTEQREGYETPIATSGPDETWAPSGLAYHDGALYAGALRGEALLVFDPATGKLVRSIGGYGRIRDVYADGASVFFITNNTDGRGNPRKGDDRLIELVNAGK